MMRITSLDTRGLIDIMLIISEDKNLKLFFFSIYLNSMVAIYSRGVVSKIPTDLQGCLKGICGLPSGIMTSYVPSI